MNTLAIDIGGTKFSMALFQGGRMIERQSHATRREGGREWMMKQIVNIGHVWQKDVGFGRCGIGFGGPVDFQSQRVTLSNVVADWQNFPLAGSLERELGILVGDQYE